MRLEETTQEAGVEEEGTRGGGTEPPRQFEEGGALRGPPPQAP